MYNRSLYVCAGECVNVRMRMWEHVIVSWSAEFWELAIIATPSYFCVGAGRVNINSVLEREGQMQQKINK